MKRSKSKRISKYAPKISIIFVALLCFAMPRYTAAQNSGVGYHGAPFLKISPAARQVALGGAFTALTNDINVMRYNIGGLGGLEHTSFGINFNSWIDDTQQGNMAFGIPFTFGAVGIDVQYFNEGRILQVDEDFQATGGEVSSGDVMFGIGYGKFLHNIFNIENLTLGLGGAFKYLNQSLAGELILALNCISRNISAWGPAYKTMVSQASNLIAGNRRCQQPRDLAPHSFFPSKSGHCWCPRTPLGSPKKK